MDLKSVHVQLIAILDQLSDINARLQSLETKPRVSGHTFEAPSAAQVAEYCTERKNNVNAEHFVNFYSSKGWLIGRNKMKDWRAAVRTWEKRDDPITVPVAHVIAAGSSITMPPYAKPWSCGWCKAPGPRGKSWGGALCTACDEIAEQPIHTGGY